MTTPKEFARELVFASLKKKDKSPSCSPPDRWPPYANEKYRGWSLSLDVYEHPDEKRFTKLPGDITVRHYRLSAKLFPIGRSSTAHDWGLLGDIVAAITHATGYPEDVPLLQPLLSIDSIHPNSTIHWMWHGDGSAVDPAVLETTAQAISMLQENERRDAVKAGLATPPHHTSEKPERNSPCPCGSGKKWKRCHGAN